MSTLKSKFFGNASFTIFCSLLIGACSYFVRRITANGLPGNEYAFFYSTFSLISILTAVMAFGIPNAAFFSLPDFRNRGNEEDARGVYAWCLRWVFFSGLLLTAVGLPLLLALGNNMERYGIHDRRVFYILLLLPLPVSMSAAMILIINGLKRFVLSNLLLLWNVVVILVGVLLFQRRYGLYAVAVSYAIGASGVVVCGLLVCWKKHGYSIAGRVDHSVRIRLLKTGAWLFLSGAGYYCFAELGNVILAYTGTPEETTKFNIALPIAVIVRSLAVVSGVFAPYSNELFQKRMYGALRKTVWYVLGITLLMAAAACPVFLIFGKQVLSSLFGRHFISAVPCTLILMIGVLFWNAARFFTDMLNSMRHENLSGMLSLGIAILGGALYLALCPRWGAVGAAWGVFVACGIWMVLTFFSILFLLKYPGREKRKIIVFMAGSSIGDTLISFPALNAIRDHYRDAEITLFSYSSYRGIEPLKELTLPCRVADRVIGFRLDRSPIVNIVHFVKLFWDMRRNDYDIAVNIGRSAVCGYEQKVRRWRIWCRLCGISELKGDKALFVFPPKRKNIPLPEVPHHMSLIARRLNADGIRYPLDRIDLHLSCDEISGAEAVWAGLDIPRDGIPVAIGIGGKQLRWRSARFAAVVEKLREKYPIVPLFFGGQENVSEIDELISSCGGVNVPRLAIPGLRTTIAFMRNCAFFIGNDTGTLHMAVAAGLRCVGIYSAHNYPGEWYPWGKGHIVLRKSLPCDGCMNSPCVEKTCLESISVDEVAAEAYAVLSSLARKKQYGGEDV